MKLIILDRDGVINYDSAQFIKSPDEWKPIPGSLEAIAKLDGAGYRVVVATNQSGVGRGLFDMDTLNAINDKMVIDDRIRENMRKYRKMDMKALIDLSVNETLPRTVMTSLTVMLALGALLIFGGHVLMGFTAAMLLGIVVGTYSSIYVSSSLLISLGLTPESAMKKVKAADVAQGAERIGPAGGAQP